MHDTFLLKILGFSGLWLFAGCIWALLVGRVIHQCLDEQEDGQRRARLDAVMAHRVKE